MVRAINVTLDDFSPAITYSPVGAWVDGPTTDPFWQSYSNNGTFTMTSTFGASAALTFNGTAVWIYGAMRSNHGLYNVTLDGQMYQDNGYNSDGMFQQVLFAASGLDGTKPHTVSIMNSPTDSIRRILDVDRIVYQIQVPDDDQEVQQQDTASSFWYSPSGWSSNPDNLSTIEGNTVHTTSLGGAYVDFEFEGSHVEIYGAVGPSDGPYMVQLDGGSSTMLNASRTRSSPQMVLYQASGLKSENHTVRITNSPFTGQTLNIDYAVVGQSYGSISSAPPSAASTAQRSTSLSGGVIGGIVAGASSFVLIVVVLLFFCSRQRRQRKPSVLPQDVLHAEFSHNEDSESTLDSSSHLTPFRVFNTVISRQPSDPQLVPQSPPSTAQDSPAQTDFSSSQIPRQPEPVLPPGPRLIVYNADGSVVESASLSDIFEEKKRLAMRERERQMDNRTLTPTPASRLASRIRNSAGQLPPDYHLATRPSTSRDMPR